MQALNCQACDELIENSPDFVVNGVTDRACASLENDTGLNPSSGHTDCEDLHNANDCLIGRMAEEVEMYEVCDWKEYMKNFVSNLYNVLKAIICAICGIWKNIHKLWEEIQKIWNAIGDLIKKINAIWQAIGGDDYVMVFRMYPYTVPKEKFIKTAVGHEMTVTGGPGTVTQWFSGSPQHGECYISIPVSEMDEVIGVWAQTQVVVSHECTQTVNVQTYERRGDYLIVNFDAYELIWNNRDTGYDLPVEFLVVGKKYTS